MTRGPVAGALCAALLTAAGALTVGTVGMPSARAAEPIDEKGWLLVTTLELPPEGDGAVEWARFDVPGVLHAFLIDGFDDLRLADGAGNEVARLVVVDSGVLAPREVELSIAGREPEGEIRVVLSGPAEAPDTLLLPGVAPGAAVSVDASLDAQSWSPLVETTVGERGRVELPPFCARLLRIRAAGVERALAVWSVLRPARGAALSPRVHDRTWRDGLLRVEIDVGVRKAPALEVEVDVEVAATGSVRGFSAPFAGVDFGERMVWKPDASAPPGRVRGRFAVPSRGQRFVRVEIPCDDPGDDVRVVRLAASAARHRVFFRRRGLVEPVKLLVGKSGVGAPEQPITRAAATFDVGLPAAFDPPDWRFLRGPRPAGDQLVASAAGRPFPWAETIATAIALALLVATIATRRRVL